MTTSDRLSVLVTRREMTEGDSENKIVTEQCL